MVDPTTYAIPFFLITLVIEGRLLRRRGTPYEFADTRNSLAMGIGFAAINLFSKVYELAFYTFLYQFRVFDIGTGPLAWGLLILGDDLCYYWYHRIGHEVRFFWAGHVTHHSSQRYHLATALRQAWAEPLLGVPFWIPLPLLGFHPVMILTMKAFSLIYQYWIHTELIGKLGPLEWFMNTPSHHRVHHGSNPQYLDKNHAGIFIVWDRLFGTFEPENEKVVYGLTKNIETNNVFVIAFHEFADIARDMKNAGSISGALHAAFRRTNAKPTPKDAAIAP